MTALTVRPSPAGRPAGNAGTAVLGQARNVPLASTLAAAGAVAAAAGVTRVADFSGLDAIGLPIVQAVRPNGRSLSVTMGKGVTPRAATVSALLEAIEVDVAERVAPAGQPRAIAEMGAAACALWSTAPRGPLAICLDPTIPREWVNGIELATGRLTPLPFDLVSLDFTRETPPDTCRTSVGLASGNCPAEALAAAVGELVEHHLAATWRSRAFALRQRCEIDLASVDDPLVCRVLARIAGAGRSARLWSMAEGHPIAAFECVISEGPGSDTALPPVRGTACHPDRTVAALGAILEAAQSRAAMIGGAREDLTPAHYADGANQTIRFALSMLGIVAAPLAWSEVPSIIGAEPEAICAAILAVAGSLSPLPLLAVELPRPHPALHVAKAVAPGLESPVRRIERTAMPVAATVARARQRVRPAAPILFAGPSICDVVVPDGVEVRPPAVAGDLAGLRDYPPPVVALVDGCFEIAPSVWHKEIVDLLAAGVSVLGAASLGAIRAAELHMFGMIGVGSLFRAYRDGHVRRDDAVMLAHAPAELGFRPLTLALVEAEAALDHVCMPAAERRMLLRIARTMPFRARTWPMILEAYARRTGRPASAPVEMLATAPSIKRRDTLELLALLQDPITPPPPCAPPPLTSFYRALR